MRAATSIKLVAIMFCLTLVTTNIMAQKPAPMNNETINMLLGKWEAEPYEVLGSKRSEILNYTMASSGQFMLIDVDGKDETGFTYKALIVMKCDADGNLTGWSFDDWGKVGTYSGKASGNKLSVTGTKDAGTDSREIEINGNKMTTKFTFAFKDKEGKDVSVTQSIIYNKK